MKKLILVVLVLFLTACGKWYGEGTVLEKEYQRGYTYYVSCGSGKTVSMCPAYNPECYWMKVRADDGEHSGCVRPKVWEDAVVGEHVVIREDS